MLSKRSTPKPKRIYTYGSTLGRKLTKNSGKKSTKPLLAKRRKKLNNKRKFHRNDNPLKTYHQKRSRKDVERYAEECQRNRIESSTPAEISFAAILGEAGIDYEREKIIYYANGTKFIIADFWLPSSSTSIEIDGSCHDSQKSYDSGRDKYLNSLGIRTIRFTNKEVLKNAQEVKERLMVEVENQKMPALPR